VGYGRVGQRIGNALVAQNLAFVVAEQNRELVETLRDNGIHAVAGDASDPAVIVQAHVARARMLVITTPDTLRVRRMIEMAVMLNPKIGILVRAHNDDEAELLRKQNTGAVFLGEQELALSMTSHILSAFEE
jgi:CPA2 family monovalent cation:H+ antiporter-2